MLVQHGARILDRAHPSTVVELGCGSGDKLAALLRAGHHLPSGLPVHLVDLSEAALATAVDRLDRLGRVDVITHALSYEAGLHQAAQTFRRPGRVLVLFLGSNIGNFDPPASDAFLRRIRSHLAPGDALLLGVDLVKPVRVMELAYDDPLQVTAAFNRNLLVRLNRELGANFVVDQFAHRAVWNPEASRMEMHLVARADQDVEIPAAALRLTIRAGEAIWTESSYKYEIDDVRRLLDATGFRVAEQFIDQCDLFALTLAEAI